MMNVVIRKAERQDVPLLLEFIKGIARYEKMENEVVATVDVLEREMFDEHRAEAVFAVVDGREVGRVAGRAWQRLWKGFATASGKDSTRTPLRKNGMDMSELEPAKY